MTTSRSPRNETADLERLRLRLVDDADAHRPAGPGLPHGRQPARRLSWWPPARPGCSASPSRPRATTRCWQTSGRPGQRADPAGARLVWIRQHDSSRSTSPGGDGPSSCPSISGCPSGYRREVLRHLTDIDYGRTESYTEVATATGQPTRGPGRRLRLRHQPDPGGRAVPPGAALRRVPGRLPRRAAGQAAAARPRVRRVRQYRAARRRTADRT